MRLRYLIFTTVLLAACSSNDPDPTQTPTPVATLTATPFYTETPFVPTQEGLEITPEVAQPTEEPPLEIVIEASEGQEIPPPLVINLPEGWQQRNYAPLYQDVDGSYQVTPATAYFGPVTGGRGIIIVLWGFSATSGRTNPFAEDMGRVSLGLDASRLLRLVVTELGCNIGNDLVFDRPYRIGGEIGEGTNFAAVGCPESVDTRGWFAGLNVGGMNFAFYAFAEPITAMDGSAPEELQAILDTVQFIVSDLPVETPAATP